MKSDTAKRRSLPPLLAARNNAGGIEGGVSNGEEIRVRGYLKPISTLRRPLAIGGFLYP